MRARQRSCATTHLCVTDCSACSRSRFAHYPFTEGGSDGCSSRSGSCRAIRSRGRTRFRGGSPMRSASLHNYPRKPSGSSSRTSMPRIWYVGGRPGRAEEGRQTVSTMAVDIRDRRLEAIVGAQPACETLADGFGFVEGPVWSARDRRLCFTDIPGNVILQWNEEDGVTALRKPSNMANGLARDRDGRLLVLRARDESSDDFEHDGSVLGLADTFEGRGRTAPTTSSSGAAVASSSPTRPTGAWSITACRARPCSAIAAFTGSIRTISAWHQLARRLRPAQRVVPFRRRASPVRQRHRAHAHSRLRPPDDGAWPRSVGLRLPAPATARRTA